MNILFYSKTSIFHSSFVCDFFSSKWLENRLLTLVKWKWKWKLTVMHKFPGWLIFISSCCWLCPWKKLISNGARTQTRTFHRIFCKSNQQNVLHSIHHSTSVLGADNFNCRRNERSNQSCHNSVNKIWFLPFDLMNKSELIKNPIALVNHALQPHHKCDNTKIRIYTNYQRYTIKYTRATNQWLCKIG